MELMYRLQGAAYVDVEETFQTRMVQMYHKHIPDKDKDYILEEFCKPDSIVRLVIASSAFGSGVDIPNVRIVYCIDGAKNVTDLWQAIGRAGRDGHPTQANICYSNRAISLCDENLKTCLKNFSSNNTSCIRYQLLASFNAKDMDVKCLDKIKSRDEQHPRDADCQHCLCCTNCKNKCEWNYQTTLE